MSGRVTSLILSGAYVNAELANEFGLLPPAFLPLGLKRLFEHQVERLAGDGFDVCLSVPVGFEVSPADRDLLDAAGVRLLRVDPEASLGAAILSCLEQVGAEGRLEILHGDTLIPPPRPWAGDACSVGDARDGYSWAAAKIEDGRIVDVTSLPPDQEMEDHVVVLSGYFAFEDAAAFREQLLKPGANFVRAVAAYAHQRSVRALNGGGWLDFGHLQTFFRSRRRMASARAFNSLVIDDRVAIKRSGQTAKLSAEAAWLAGVPAPVRVFTGRLIDRWEEDGGYAYSTEYEYLPTLAELYVFGRLNRASWSRILDSCVAYLRLASSLSSDDGPPDALRRLTIAKTTQRLDAHAEAAGLDLDAPNILDGEPAPSLRAVARAMAAIVDDEPARPATLMHGDFCFSNILYNSRAERVRLIDPRGGVDEGAPGIFGDFRYDVAKLAHSVVGRYDMIMTGRYTLAHDPSGGYALSFPDDAERDWLEAAFAEKVLARLGLEPRIIWAVMITLFLSMLPLHADSPRRQTAFVANALRLHRRYFAGV